MPADLLTEKANDVLDIAEKWLQEGRSIALATVVETWGSSPRPQGSHLVADKDGNFEGSVSGGCVETAVISAARECLESGGCRMLEFGVSNELAWEVGLACGGRIQVYIEAVSSGNGPQVTA